MGYATMPWGLADACSGIRVALLLDIQVYVRP